MIFIVRGLKSIFVIVFVFAVLAILVASAPRVGQYSAVVIAVVGIVSFIRPITVVWIEGKFTAVFVIAIAMLAFFASLHLIEQHQILARQEMAEKNEARLKELRGASPASYLAELKATNDVRWEAEFKVLDKDGYEVFVAERRAKEEGVKRVSIAALTTQLKSVPANDVEVLLRIYSQLADLQPENRAHKAKRDDLDKEIKKRRLVEAQLGAQRENPARYVTLENFSWSKGGFGSVMVASFSIKNSLPWAVKDVEIECKHSAASGTAVDRSKRTLYERIDANKSKRVADFNMGFIHSQAARSGCEIISVISLQ